MARKTSRCIILFVKAPVEGLVKTRLAGRIGTRNALTLYRAFVSDIRHTLAHIDSDIRIYYHPEGYDRLVNDWLGSDTPLFLQEGDDLGARMYNALAQAFVDGFGSALLIGSDVPELTLTLLTDAFSALETHPAVIGPAIDGGYYLIGFNQNTLFKDAFTGVPWSTPDVSKTTLSRFQAIGRRPHLLPLLRDIDTFADLISLESSLNAKSQTTAFQRNAFSHTRLAIADVRRSC